ncbi:hypothetical protein BaRGS_00013360, partial [Batillaria attramentaria]
MMKPSFGDDSPCNTGDNDFTKGSNRYRQWAGPGVKVNRKGEITAPLQRGYNGLTDRNGFSGKGGPAQARHAR